MSEIADQTEQPRIEPEANPDDEQGRLLSKTLLSPGSEPLNLFRVLVRHPELMKRVNALGGLFMAHNFVPARAREMAILRIAWATECDYEYAQHVGIARRVGLSEQEIGDLGLPIDQGRWQPGDAALLGLVDGILEKGEAPNDAWGKVHIDLDDGQMLELVMLVGYYQMLAAFLKTVRVPLEDGQLGRPE